LGRANDNAIWIMDLFLDHDQDYIFSIFENYGHFPIFVGLRFSAEVCPLMSAFIVSLKSSFTYRLDLASRLVSLAVKSNLFICPVTGNSLRLCAINN